MGMKTQRLLGVLSVLINTERITVQELAQRFEVSKRTIFRDIETLLYAGFPIQSFAGIGGGISIVEGYKIDTKILSLEDTEKLYIALNALKSLNKDNTVNDLLAKLVPESEKTIFGKSNYMINLSSWFEDGFIREKAEALSKAIETRQCIRIEYVSKQGRSIRIIQPYKLVFKSSYWYVYGYCQQRNDFRLFRLNRIVTLEVLKVQFEEQDMEVITFNQTYGENLFAREYRKGDMEVILEYNMEDEFALTQKIDASFLYLPENKKDKPYIKFYTKDLLWAKNLVFSLLDKVQVVSPPKLYQEVAEELKKIQLFYKR